MSKNRQASTDFLDDWKAGIRCWIECRGKVVLGKGRVELLEHIDSSRSIRSAARDLGMSYRRAWLLVQSANDGAGEPLVVTATGGKQGGGASLTARGRELVALFHRLDRDLREAAEKSIASFAHENANPDKTVSRAKSVGRQSTHKSRRTK